MTQINRGQGLTAVQESLRTVFQQSPSQQQGISHKPKYFQHGANVGRLSRKTVDRNRRMGGEG